MYFKIIAHILILICCLKLSLALRCYDCRYDEGSSRDKDCENNPGLEYSKEVSFLQNSLSRHISTNSFSDNRMGMFGVNYGDSLPNGIENQRTVFWFCMKITGKAYGKKVVIRGSAFTLVHNGHEICENRLPPNLESLGLTDVKTCYCDTKDNCNGSSTFKLSFAVVFISVILYMLRK